jgi:hypothetical protein
MDLNAVNTFSELLAKCAAAGDMAPLRKEAAAQSLVKEAITAAQLLMPLGGAAIGGAAGYLGTDNEKRKLRNALYGALTGGVAGAGAQLAAPMFKDIVSRVSGNGSPAAAAQGGGQFSVAPEQPAAKATGTAPASAAAPPATAGATSSAPAATTENKTAPPTPAPDINEVGAVGAPMTNARLGTAALAGAGGSYLTDRAGLRLSEGGFSGRRGELNRFFAAENTPRSLKNFWDSLQQPANAPESFLRPAPAKPARVQGPRIRPEEYASLKPKARAKVDAEAQRVRAINQQNTSFFYPLLKHLQIQDRNFEENKHHFRQRN